MDIFDTLRSKKARRLFLTLCLLAAILIAGTHIGLTIWLQYIKENSFSFGVAFIETLTILTKGVFAGIITAAFLLFVYQFLFPSEESLKAVECVDPQRTLGLHKAALAETEFWLHSGHIGRWVRVHAIPALASTARDRGISTRIAFHIINPNDHDLCTQYSNYRALINYKERAFATLDDTQAEILATVLRACMAMDECPGLSIEIYFKRSMDLTRLDICSSLAFRTMIDPRSPAVVYRNLPSYRQHSFYDALKLSLEYELKRTERFCPVRALSRTTLDNGAEVAKFLEDSGLEYPATPGFIEQVIKRVLSEYTPYE